jgi:hypothetical protein
MSKTRWAWKDKCLVGCGSRRALAICIPTRLLIDFEHDAETRFATHHTIVGPLRLLERKNLVHRCYAVELTKQKGIFGVDGRAGIPHFTEARLAMRSSELTVSVPTASMTIRVPLTPRPAQIACIALAFVTVAMIAFAPPIPCSAAAGSAISLSIGSQRTRERFLVATAIDGDGSKSLQRGELHAEMTEAADPVYRNQIARLRAAVPECVEGGKACTEQRR